MIHYMLNVIILSNLTMLADHLYLKATSIPNIVATQYDVMINSPDEHATACAC